MPPSKRKSRRKVVDPQELSEQDLVDSSPSRPSAKKRKVNGTRTSIRRKSPSPDPSPQTDDSSEESEAVSQTDLIDSVVSYLQVSKEPVIARTEYANDREQADNSEKVSAYAKIAGRDWTYFVREQAVNIGRPPDDRPTVNGTGASSPLADLKEVLPVHIDLGPSKIVSRHHASIFYDADFPEGGGWHVRVNGRNGVRVNNALLKRGNRQQIKSGVVLEIANTQMMFVTPVEKAQIDQYFIDRAKQLATGEEFVPVSHAHPEPAQNVSNQYGPSSNYQSLAPAPPNLRRVSTPPPVQADGRNQRGVFDSKSAMSPMYGRGMMMESTQEIDYSRDSAKDLKPPYSYATMIAQAIFSSEEEKLTLSNIYSFIADKYAFYRHSNSGWQNSIRHNLSLNKAFQKVPRRTDEPGKGMKWQIAPEYRQEYWKKQARRGGGSAPSSPASSKDMNPNFRGPNGQNLGYDTSMVSSFSAKDMSDRHVPPHPVKMNLNLQMGPSFPPYPPQSGYPQGIPGLAPPPSNLGEAVTPQRQRTDTMNTVPDGNEIDDSPLTHAHFRPSPRSNSNGLQVYTLPSSAPPPHHSPTNPTLSSSFFDTPFHPNQHSIITPAPLRQNPRLAPPSTLVAPSKFMPESSPAGPGLFWKGLMGVTPGQMVPDMSPVKDDDSRVNGLDRNLMSSSPPPMDGGMSGSPSKPGRGSSQTFRKSFKEESTPSSYPHPYRPISSASKPDSMNESRREKDAPPLSQSRPSSSFGPGSQPNPKNDNQRDDEEDDGGDGGFDLARGFAPIGGGGSIGGGRDSFHSHAHGQRSGSMNATSNNTAATAASGTR